MFSSLKNLSHWILTRFNKNSLFKAALLLAVVIGLRFYFSDLVAVITLLGDQKGLTQQIEEYGSLGAIILVIVLILQVIVAALPGHLLIIAGGYLFGFTNGFLLTHISIVISSQICYWLAQKYGRPIIERLAPSEGLEKWTLRAKRQGITFFIVSFNLPFFPNDVMNYVAGLSGISSRKFLIANILGKLPTSIMFTLIGSHGFDFSWQIWIAAMVLTLVIVGIWQVVGPRVEQRYFATKGT